MTTNVGSLLAHSTRSSSETTRGTGFFFGAHPTSAIGLATVPIIVLPATTTRAARMMHHIFSYKLGVRQVMQVPRECDRRGDRGRSGSSGCDSSGSGSGDPDALHPGQGAARTGGTAPPHLPAGGGWPS